MIKEIFLIVLVILLIYTNKHSSNDIKNINILLQQTARWLTASFNDINPYIANLHSDYAQGYLMALDSLYSEIKIQNVTGVNIHKLKHLAGKAKYRAMNMLVKICPDGAPKQEFLAKLAGQG